MKATILFVMISIVIEIHAQSYCSVTSNCDSGDRLDSTIVGSTILTSSSLCSTNGYSTNLTTSSSLSFTTNTSYSFIFKLQRTTYSEGIAVFFDMNNDGDFADVNEKVFNTPSLVQGINGNVQALINVPSGNYNGVTRMRIRVKYSNNTILPCETYTYGETEDYAINLTVNPNNSIGDEITIGQTNITNDTTIFAHKSITVNNGTTFNSPNKDVNLVSKNRITINPGTIITTGTKFSAVIDTLTENENGAGIINVLDSLEYKFISIGQIIRLEMIGANFSSINTDYKVSINDAQSSISNLTITNNLVSFNLPLVIGQNRIQFLCNNSNGQLQSTEFIVWAGSSVLSINVVDENNNNVSNANVIIFLSDDINVGLKGVTNSSGLINFSNIPQRTILTSASIPNKYISSVAAINSSTINLVLKLQPFNTPSSIDNNDFASQNVNGWDIGTAPVTIVTHDEDPGVNTPTNITTDYDLRLSTSGQGPKSISRTFTIKPQTKKVTIRYRFITTEVPGGYFGSQFNDYFAVRLRSQASVGISGIENSMNGLGLGEFNYSTGATYWKTINLPVLSTGDNVQVELTVANVADGLFDSYLEVDIVQEGKLAIVKAELNDKEIHTNNIGTTIPIQHLSLDSPNPYLQNSTYLWGKIKIQGEPNDVLTSLQLKVLNNGAVVATGNLSTNAQSLLLKTFPSNGIIEITNPIRLFEIPQSVGASSDITYQLKIEAQSQSGEFAFLDDPKSLTNGKLVALNRFKGINRYGTRDSDRGGDDWGKPSVISLVNNFPSSWLVNDICDMNGGKFPPHSGHNTGKSIDVDFPGYREYIKVNGKVVLKDFITKASTATELITYLNSSAGIYVKGIFASFQSGSPFESKINTTLLNDGTYANTKIKYWSGHHHHFHVEMKDNTSSALTTNSLLISKRLEKNHELMQKQLIYLNNEQNIVKTTKSVLGLENDNLSFRLNLKSSSNTAKIEITDFDDNLIKEFENSFIDNEFLDFVIESKYFNKKGQYFINIKTLEKNIVIPFTVTN